MTPSKHSLIIQSDTVRWLVSTLFQLSIPCTGCSFLIRLLFSRPPSSRPPNLLHYSVALAPIAKPQSANDAIRPTPTSSAAHHRPCWYPVRGTPASSGTAGPSSNVNPRLLVAASRRAWSDSARAASQHDGQPLAAREPRGACQGTLMATRPGISFKATSQAYQRHRLQHLTRPTVGQNVVPRYWQIYTTSSSPEIPQKDSTATALHLHCTAPRDFATDALATRLPLLVSRLPRQGRISVTVWACQAPLPHWRYLDRHCRGRAWATWARPQHGCIFLVRLFLYLVFPRPAAYIQSFLHQSPRFHLDAYLGRLDFFRAVPRRLLCASLRAAVARHWASRIPSHHVSPPASSAHRL